jgi:hypothetical protein
LCGPIKGVFQFAGYTAVQKLYTKVYKGEGKKKIADVHRNIFRFATLGGGAVSDMACGVLEITSGAAGALTLAGVWLRLANTNCDDDASFCCLILTTQRLLLTATWLMYLVGVCVCECVYV